MKKTVLIVDDEIELLKSYVMIFEDYRDLFSIITAADGLTAVRKLKENKVSLVVTNLNMPGIDGFTLMDYIRRHHPYVPVIVTTGYSIAMEKPSFNRGAVAFIEKPFLFEDLVNTMILVMTTDADFHGTC